MALVCSISNEVPETAVISPASGGVFEKRLIEKLLAENGNKDPINGQTLLVEQLIEIKTPSFVKAKPPTYTSIPGILKSLQDEWDAVMLHSFTLRQQLQTARQELSHALYQHDAACRVIARLTKEVSAAREALATLKPQASAYPSNTGAEVSVSQATAEAVGISAEVHQKLQDTAAVLTQERKRKGKSVPENLASAETVRQYRTIATHTGLHSASNPGILCMDVHQSGSTVVTGGNDKCVTVFDKDSEQILATLKGHSKKIVSVISHPDESLVVSGSMDCTIRLWHVPSSQPLQILRAHDGAITGLSLHATGDYILSSSMDQHWAFSDFRTGTLLAKVLGDEEHPLFAARFHPDGLIFATGTLGSTVKIWDLKEQTNVANFSGHSGRITSIAFSENGYYLATAAEDACVKLWDLRKLKNFKSIQMDEGYNITDLSFDQTGSYLGVSGSDVKIIGCKVWNEVNAFSEHTATVTSVRFGNNCGFIASTSMDRTLKIYGSD